MMRCPAQLSQVQLSEIADRTTKFVCQPGQKQSIHSVDANDKMNELMESHRQLQDDFDNMCAIQQQTSNVKCATCKKNFVNIGRHGKPFENCRDCFIKSRPHQRDPVYNTSAVTRQNSGKCRDCSNEATRARLGGFLPRCRDCHVKFNQGRNQPRMNIQAFDDVISQSIHQVGIDQVDDAVQKAQFLAIKVNSIHKVPKKSKFNPDRYRVKTKVFGGNKSTCLQGLIDTGCNTDALSLEACQKLGIQNQIKKVPSVATGVDGNNLTVIGSVDASIQVGNIPYTNTFPVLNKIDQFDVMIGTRFMQSVDLMTKVVDLMKDNLGADNIERTNYGARYRGGGVFGTTCKY